MRLLDLFCGAGGAAMGYQRAGFEVVGVDINPQPHYPFEFHQADALAYPLDGFDVIHASPPCQRYSTMTKRHAGCPESHPDLIGDVRDRILPYGQEIVIENVPGAPLAPGSLMLCGSMFGLKLRRHRLFECSRLMLPPRDCDHSTPVVGVYGHPGGSSKRDGRSFGSTADWREAMGIDWMTTKEMAESIPPAYTEWIGTRLMEIIA